MLGPMKLSSLAKLLSGELGATSYSLDLALELQAHRAGLGVCGGVAPVLVEEDADVVLDRAGLARLCTLFARGELTAPELAYTADILQMADRVDISDEEVATLLAECTDPEINGILTVDRAMQIAAA